MKKLLILCVVALLAACQPATPVATVLETPVPQSTVADTEILAVSEADLIGIWYAKSSALMFDITRSGVPDANLALALYYIEPDPWQKIGTSEMNFDNGKLTYLAGKTGCVVSATYEIHLTSHDGEVTGMRPVLVGEDACVERRISLDGKVLTRVAP